MKLALLVSLTALLSAHDARALTSIFDWTEGIATFYGGAPDGALGLPEKGDLSLGRHI